MERRTSRVPGPMCLLLLGRVLEPIHSTRFLTHTGWLSKPKPHTCGLQGNLHKEDLEAKRPGILVQSQRPHWASLLMQPWRCPGSQNIWNRES